MPMLYGLFVADTIVADAATLAAVSTTSLRPGVRYGVTGLGVFEYDPTSTATADDLSYIAASGGGNWVLLSATGGDGGAYLMLNASNHIDGSQISSVTDATLSNGTAALPSLSFLSDPDTGIYRVGANDIGISTGGTLRFDVSTTAVTSTLPVVHPDGAAATPSIRVTSEASGMYLAAAGSLGLSVAGVIKANLTATALNLASGVGLQIATVAVVGPRNTGWTTFAGTGTKNQGAINVDTFTATDANIRLLGQGVKGMLDALITHGLLGA